MREKIIKLIEVKSIITLSLTAVFSVLSLKGQVTAEQFQTVFTTIIAFYFGVQYQKGNAAKQAEKHREYEKIGGGLYEQGIL